MPPKKAGHARNSRQDGDGSPAPDAPAARGPASSSSARRGAASVSVGEQPGKKRKGATSAVAPPAAVAPPVPAVSRRGTSRDTSADAPASTPGRGQGRGRSRGRGQGRGAPPAVEPPDVPSDEPAGDHGQNGSSSSSHVIKRGNEVDSLLAAPASTIGHGTNATVLFHETAFDAAMIMLEPGGSELHERNGKSSALLYFITEAEEGQVEFKVPAHSIVKRVSKGGEILVPGNVAYSLRNHSRTTSAKVVAVVPV